MKQSGNALFLILIAVTLFAALSYAVTQSGRGGGNIDRETVSINAAQATQYAALVRQTIERLLLLNGCAPEEISFENAVVVGYVNTTPSPTDNSCHVFEAAGGGLTWQSPPNSLNDGSEWLFLGENRLFGSARTLIIMLPNLSETACNEINRAFGIASLLTDLDGFNTNNLFDGSYAFTTQLRNFNEYDGCVRSDVNNVGGSVAGNFYFFSVLHRLD